METQTLNALDGAEIFQDLTSEELQQIARFSERLHLDIGDVLIHENERERFDIYLLCDGVVEIVSSNSTETSAECVLSREDKSLFGEISWLTRHKRTATVRCRGPVDAVRIDGEGLGRYLKQNPRAGYHVMAYIAKLLANRMTETDSLLKQILWNTGI